MKQDPETPSESLTRLRRVVDLAPRDPELRLLLARTLLDNSLKEEAIEQIRSVIALSPNHLEARKLLERALESPRPHPS